MLETQTVISKYLSQAHNIIVKFCSVLVTYSARRYVTNKNIDISESDLRESNKVQYLLYITL